MHINRALSNEWLANLKIYTLSITGQNKKKKSCMKLWKQSNLII